MDHWILEDDRTIVLFSCVWPSYRNIHMDHWILERSLFVRSSYHSNLCSLTCELIVNGLRYNLHIVFLPQFSASSIQKENNVEKKKRGESFSTRWVNYYQGGGQKFGDIIHPLNNVRKIVRFALFINFIKNFKPSPFFVKKRIITYTLVDINIGSPQYFQPKLQSL